MNNYGLVAESHFKWETERLTDTFNNYAKHGFNKTVEYLVETRFIPARCAEQWITDSLRRFKK